MRRTGALRDTIRADRQRGEATKEEDEKARKKTQKSLQMKTVEEKRRRKSTTFKPPTSNDFQNAADIALSQRILIAQNQRR